MSWASVKRVFGHLRWRGAELFSFQNGHVGSGEASEWLCLSYVAAGRNTPLTLCEPAEAKPFARAGTEARKRRCPGEKMPTAARLA